MKLISCILIACSIILCPKIASSSSLTFFEDFTIDQLDSVIFNIDEAIMYPEGEDMYLDLPVHIISDDVINALDFSIVLDTFKLEFVKTTPFVNEMQSAAHVSKTDATLRFTSNSFTEYNGEGETIVILKFRLLEEDFDTAFINVNLALLNGEPCSYMVKGDTAMVNVFDTPYLSGINIYPNPVSHILNLRLYDATSAIDLKLTTIDGKLIYSLNDINPEISINVFNYPEGMYVLSLYQENTLLSSTKLMIKQ